MILTKSKFPAFLAVACEKVVFFQLFQHNFQKRAVFQLFKHFQHRWTPCQNAFQKQLFAFH